MKARPALLGLSLALALPPSTRAADAAEIYRRKCAGCHGADGGGGPKKLPPLGSPEVQAKSDAELFELTARGTPDRKMPAFRGRLADEEIRAAVAHLRTLKR